MLKKIITLVLMSLTILLKVYSQSIEWRYKVEPTVLHQINTQVTDYIVVFGEQADLSEAARLKTKAEKGKFVYQKLSEVAAATQKNVKTILEQSNIKHETWVIVNAIVVKKSDKQILQNIASLPEVKSILADPAVKMEMPIYGDSGERTTEWGISKIKADSVWMMGFYGQNVVIAGQDTGYDWEHPSLKDKYRGTNGATADHNYNWFDAIDATIQPNPNPNNYNSTNNPYGYNLIVPVDDQGHGTHTMGTMVGHAGTDTIGVAVGAKWIGCRNMDRGWGKPSSYTSCFNWFLAPRDISGNNPLTSKAPDVINNSWGCPVEEGCTTTGTYALMEAAVNNLKSAGIMVVVSAGNSGNGGSNDCSTVNTPAAIFEHSFSVGATNINDDLASFSSRGPAILNGINRLKPNVTAPGVNVRSAFPGNSYGPASGTSMAGPHVAGAVALIISASPSLKGQVETIESLLENTAKRIQTTQDCGGTANLDINNNFGHGRINVFAAIAQALPIKLTIFYGKIEDAGNRLLWETELESNTAYFDIERSTDGFVFKKIGQVKAVGFSTFTQRYDFLDKDTAEGTSYYRLKQIDRDGVYEYSKIITLRRVNRNHVTIGPNPTEDVVNIRMNIPTSKEVQLDIINVAGQIIQSYNYAMPKGFNELALNMSFLPKGYYTIRASEGNKEIIFQKPIILN